MKQSGFTLWRWTLPVAAVMAGVTNAVVAFRIPRFAGILEEMTEGRTLPVLSRAVLEGAGLLQGVALLLLLAGGGMFFLNDQEAKRKHWIAATLISLMLLQVGLTILAIFLPLTEVIEGMEGATSG